MRLPFRPRPVTKQELADYRAGKNVRDEVAQEAARLGITRKDHTDAARALRAARIRRTR